MSPPRREGTCSRERSDACVDCVGGCGVNLALKLCGEGECTVFLDIDDVVNLLSISLRYDLGQRCVFSIGVHAPHAVKAVCVSEGCISKAEEYTKFDVLLKICMRRNLLSHQELHSSHSHFLFLGHFYSQSWYTVTVGWLPN